MPVVFTAHAAQPRAFWLLLLLALHRSLVTGWLCCVAHYFFFADWFHFETQPII